MKLKEKKKKKFKKQEKTNDIVPYNNFNPNELPYADDYMNILNDYDSEQESPNKEKKTSNQLKYEVQENKKLFEAKSKINSIKKVEEKDESKEKSSDILIQIKNDITKINKENKEQLPPLYLYDKIKDEIFSKINLKEEIKESFIKSEIILNLEKRLSDETFYSKKTRKRGLNKSNEEIKKKRGRKKNDETSDALHNKNSEDNIIKKIKSKLLDYLLIFINDLLKSLKEKNKINLNINSKNEKELENTTIIKKIDYNKIVNVMKKKDNLAFLKMTLKIFLSNKISSKYSTLSKDLNKNTINELLNKEKENLIIKYIFNLTFGDWIDIYTYKKEITDFGIIDNETIKEIEKNFKKVDLLLVEIYNLNYGNNYFSLFISLLYNFERWFYVKQDREKKDKNIKEKNEK